jgi:hypothetical protein
MTAVLVEITSAPSAVASDEIELVDVDDLLSSPAIAPGCGDDNPYQA